jgi:Bacterial Ig-like domain (group 3)/FG-GAP-like repeat
MFSKSATLSLACLTLIIFMSSHASAKLFGKPQTYASGGTPFSAVIADVNGDDTPDLLVANFNNGTNEATVGVLLGNGDGTFQTVQTYSVGFHLLSIVVADVNRDGHPDVLVSLLCNQPPQCNGQVGVLLGKGDGTFQTPQTYYSSGGQYAGPPAVADLNRDGNPDILVPNGRNNSSICGPTGVLLGNGDGTFRAAQLYETGACNAGQIAVADVNGDGKLDLLVADGCITSDDCSHGAVGVLLGNGDGTLQAAHTYDTFGQSAGFLDVKDVNGDRKLDVVVVSECVGCTNGSIIAVLMGNGDGSFQNLVAYNAGAYVANDVKIADVNRDGHPDLLVSSCFSSTGCINRFHQIRGKGELAVLLGNGDGTFQTAQTYYSGSLDSSSVAVAELNGDGKLDVVLANEGSPGCTVSGCTPSVGVLFNTYFAPTTTTLSSTPNPSTFGHSVTLTATVTSSSLDKPTGKVIFKNGGTAFGSAILSGGVATLNTTKLPVGTLSLTAVYQGDTFSAKSTSAVLMQVVNP